MQGTEIGNYHITYKLGEGGMGVVYAAQHKILNRPAAIKILLKEHVDNQQLIARFVNEAKAATNIRHPGIVEVYDFGHGSDGSVFIAMELLQGENLEMRMRRLGKLPPIQAVLFTQQICSALQAAHNHNIVHRDLKPSNIFIVPDPQVTGGERIKLLDFGIAKFTAPGEAGAVATKAGSMMGTPQYMPPEQCTDSSKVDHRIDIYATGCILFQMLCGRTPFVGETYVEILSAQMYDDPPPPSTLAPEVSREVDDIVLKALAKDPANRYQSAAELATALQIALGDSLPSLEIPELAARTLTGDRQTQRAFSRWLIALVALVVTAVGGVAFMLVQTDDTEVATAADGSITPDAPPGPEPILAVACDQRHSGDPSTGPEQITWLIRSSPPGAEVRQGDKVVGNTATALLCRTAREPARKERFELRLDGYETAYLDVTTTETLSRVITLAPSIAIKIESRPTAAQVYLPGDEYVGNTPLELTGGQGKNQTIILKRDGYRDEARTVEFTKRHTLRIKLTKMALVSIRIESEPSGAEVWQGEILLGQTPYTETLSKEKGRREYTIKHDGCKDKTIKLRAYRDDSALATLNCKQD